MTTKIAWIGTGVMGYAMVNHLIAAGFDVNVANRSFEKTQGLQAKRCHSVAEAVAEASVIFTMVGYPQDVLDTYAEIFEHAPKNALCIDMTTSDPQLAKDLDQHAKQKGYRLLDAPVSGGDIGAKNASLAIMVGGEYQDYQDALPYFEKMGKNINYMGPCGSGQHCKMANQIVVAGNLAAVSEAIAYAQAMGLDPQAVIDAISGGAASSWQLLNNGPKMIRKDYRPGFYIHHFIKDLSLVLKQDQIQDLPVVKMVLSRLKRQVENDPSSATLGTQAYYETYEN